MRFLSDDDIYLFEQGNHFRLYETLGAHFAVRPPDTEQVFVMGDFYGRNNVGHRLSTQG